ncbi:MAG: carboxypeptidase regulatory-like domain-containing protein, partial [Bacteroidales bacterium]|nr:carboxypeptidase regulatory-like domain-containing protein [Bacteroidales bacterium]
MKSYHTYSRWLLLLAMGLFLFGSSASLFAQETQREQAIIDAMHGPTVEVPQSDGRAVGDNCTTPIVVNIPADLPYADVGNTTCGRGNTYQDSDLGSYDGGEDIIYELIVTAETEVVITMDPNGTTWTGLGLFNSCPSSSGNSIETVTGSSLDPREINTILAPGTYYVMADTWPTPTCIPVLDLFIVIPPPPPVLQAITAFPFEEDFESGAFPPTGDVYVLPVTNAESDAYVSGVAGNGSAFGAILEGGSSTGWIGGSSSTTYDNAFTDNVTHIAELSMIIEPDIGNPGYLFLSFDMRQNYSFGRTYEWFRVLVDGVPVADLNGDTYWNPSTPEGDPWKNLTFDLSAFKNLASFEITLQNSGKYDLYYFDGGDVAMIDNLQVLYSVPGLEIVNAILDMEDRPIGAWMKPAAFQIVNNPGAGDIVINEADIDETFGGFLAVEKPALPFSLPSGETTYEFGIKTTEAPVGDGPFSGSFAMFFGSRAVVTADYTGNAYTPVAGDVWEMAFDADAVAFPDNVVMGSFVDNYDLPGATADGWDAVYKIDVDAGDIIVDIDLTGTDAKMALYPADFDGVGGPDMDNALESATTAITGLELFEGVYYLVVSATGADFTLDYTPTVMPAPDAVTNLTPSDGAVDIENGDMLTWSWGANTLEYRVVLGTTYPPATVVQDWATANTATDGSYTLAGLNPNLQYFWRIDTRNNNGTTNGDVWGFTTTISSPTDLEAVVNDPGESSATVSASLTWTGPTNRAFVGYNVYRDGVKITPTPVANASFTDLGLARNTTYSYYVTNVYDEGESAASNTVSVTTQGVGTADGVIYDYLSGDPIEGANVLVEGTSGVYSLTTGADGVYSTLAYAGVYSITASASGYTNKVVNGVVVSHGVTVSNDIHLMEVPLPVGEVTAFELSDDAVQISWDGSGPEPPQPVTFRYDDGVRVAQLGSGGGDLNTVLGAAHPVNATLQELSWLLSDAVDAGGPHATIKLYVMGLKADGTPDGGNVLYSATVSNVDGVWNTHVLPAPVEAPGGFFIGAAYNGFLGIGTDDGLDDPYAFVPGTQFFTGDYTGGAFSDIADFGFEVNYLIRAYGVENAVLSYVASDEPQPRVENADLALIRSYPSFVPHPVWKTKPENAGNGDRGIIDYTVSRETVYRPLALAEIGNTSQQNFVDFDWETMEWGVYRWAVNVNYDAGQVSPAVYSNTLDKNMEVMVDVAVSLNSNEAPGGTSVTFTNMSEPGLELVYNATLDNSGAFAWDEFRRGVYDIEVMLPGYAIVTETAVEIFDDASFTWLLEELLSSPSNLYVTPTAFATWDLGGGGGGGAFTPFLESFDGLLNGELPVGWTKSPETTNWGVRETSNNAGGTAPEMRFNWSPSGTDAFYLMTPMMSTEGQSSLQLTFKQYINDYNSNYTMRVVAIADGVEYIIEEWLDPSILPDITPMDMSYVLNA